MPFSNLALIRYNFRWGSGDESQSIGIFVQKVESGPWPAPGELEAAQDIAAKGVDSWKANMTVTNTAAAVTAVDCTVYTMASDGVHVSEKGVAPFSGSNAWAGTGGTALPAENSIVLSFNAIDPDAFQGAHPGRVRGRVYLPTPPTGVLSSGGGVTQTVVDQIITDWQGWYDEITGVIVPSGGDSYHVRPVIRSLGGKGGAAAEATYPITWIRVGHVVDTQRRRRKSLQEAYTTHELT